MSEDPIKKPTTQIPEQPATEPSLEQPSVVENYDEAAEKLKDWMEKILTETKERDETIKTSLDERVDTLPDELKDEAAKIIADAKEAINQNEAEFSSAREATLKEVEDAFFIEGQSMGGDGPLRKETEPEKSEIKIDSVLRPNSNFEQTEGKSEEEKQQEVVTFTEGLKAMLADPDLPDEERADIEEQIAGFEESLGEAEASGRTVYEPVAESKKEIITKIQETRPTLPDDKIVGGQASEIPVKEAQATPPTSVSSEIRHEVVTRSPQETRASEQSISREQLLAERRQLQREWEKEATKATERQMGKEEKKKYQELVTGRVAKDEKEVKKGRLTADERQKLISDVGFTLEDYNLMKAGSKPWTLNAIWKRLGELDREISEARPAESAPLPRPASPTPEARPSAISGEISSRPTSAEDEIVIDEDEMKVKELAEASKILNGVLAKLDEYFKNTNTEMLEKISANPLLANGLAAQAKQGLAQWETADLKAVAEALVPEYGLLEDIAKLGKGDLEAVKQHFIDKLLESMKLAEHPLGAKSPRPKGSKRKNYQIARGRGAR